MRIICPECEAQYEVPDEAIPTEGRDVQCSNCDATWFVAHPDHPVAAKHRPDNAPEPLSRGDKPAADAEGQSSGDVGGEVEETPPLVPPRKELDPEVARILREEARRESDARAADSLEVQPELGLMQVRAAPSKPAQHDQRSAGPAQAAFEKAPVNAVDEDYTVGRDVAPGVAPGTTPRRNRRPDMEEIDSRLRSSSARYVAEHHSDASGQVGRRRGFRRGFLAAVVIFAVGLLIYQFAPEIAEVLPQVDPWLSAYVTWADDLRTVLDGVVRDVLTWLEDVSTPDI